ncbi:MAG TPA: phosphoenolpyruvate--protein phosphotransferase [Steroidobacteraceae bacterium]|nr:phosphoenolpyruvate--protein phosphotransferase [Steroidobacteraceae bacterium]
MSTLKIMAPLTGWCAPLDEVPDQVFAGRMLGDGLAIDPTSGVVMAPCAGEIITLPASAHAVSIRTAQGIDVLIHIGIDTVELRGRGFEPRVQPGAMVRAGDELIRFNLDIVARGAKSLMTPIVIAPVDGVAISQRRAQGPVTAGEILFEIGPIPELASTLSQPSTAAAAAEPAVSRTLNVALRHGLHARPAAMLANRAKTFAAQVSLKAHGRSANARSVVAVMALGVRHGDGLTIQAIGPDAPQAVAGVVAALEEAETIDAAAGDSAAAPAAPAAGAAPSAAPAGSGVLNGITAVGGFEVGRATRIERRKIDVVEHSADSAHEAAELERALTNVRLRLQRVAATGGATRREIIEAHLEFLSDPSLQEAAHGLIAAGKGAGFAWRGAVRQSISALEALDDARMRERADDLLDVEAHVLLALAGEARPMIMPLPEHAVLLADDLLPSEITALDRQRLAAICLGAGGTTSHVAILAAAMEVPMLVGIGPGMKEIADGSTVIVDADGGRLHIKPSASEIEQARGAVESRRLARIAQRAAARTECRALDGTRIEVFANLGNIADAAAAALNGAEGCGLLRTEFLFIDRETAPGEDQQLAAYQGIANALGDVPVILRLMDVGGDKPLRYLTLPHEDNPALGMRGVRTALAHPELLRAQLRAALRVVPFGKVRLLIPMVTDAAEIRAVRSMVDELTRELSLPGRVELGAMIETPAAALTAALIGREVEFLSIGSNDLTQYTLAMDRGHSELARRTDALHPAVLKLIASTADAGTAAGKLVAVCGGVAADSQAVPILLGLGVRELSVVPAAIPALKQQIRGLQMLECRELAMRCLGAASAGEVRALVEKTIANGGGPT